MNYYRRYPGDYMRDTAHLSLSEHGAYTLLLDHQYSTEQSIPADLDSIYRLCRAMTPEDQAAVRAVVDKFFPMNCSGRLNPRASRQIPDERARIDAARQNGKKGGRPANFAAKVPHGPEPNNNPVGLLNETQQEPSGLADKNPEAKLPSPSPTTEKKTTLSSKLDFDRWYSEYPRKEARAKAEQAWNKLKPEADVLIAAVRWQKIGGCLQNNQADGRSLIPLPASWLNGKRWLDEKPIVPVRSAA